MLGFFLDVLRGSGDSDFGASPSWYIISVRRNHEKKVHEELVRKGIESFQPLVEEERQWSDRKKRIELPLFPGYGFVRISAKERLAVLGQRGVVRFVADGHHAAVVPDDEIRSLQLAMGCAAHVHAVDSPAAGSPVLLANGPLAGIRGIVANPTEAKHVVIPIESLHRAVAVDVDADLTMDLTTG